MATPTPSSSSKYPASLHHTQPHQETTPGSLGNHPSTSAFSPAPPRSVAHSPAGPSYLAKKSPANYAFATGSVPNSGSAAMVFQHPTGSSMPSNPSIGGLGAIGLGSGGSQMLNFDSPSAAAALGLNLQHIPGLEGVGGHMGRAGGAGDEDERRRRMEAILGLIGSRPGRVGPESVESLARRTGLECLWEEGADDLRTLSMAGTGVLIDVDFKRSSVTRVSLSFPTSPDSLTTLAPKAARILHRELAPPTPGLMTRSLNTSLGPFSEHLERLARLDKLSSPPQFNCFEAIAGMHASLERIFAWEKQKVKEESKGASEDEAVELEVLCKRSGRPRMHAENRIGLSLEYWTQRRLVPPPPRKRNRDGSIKEDPGHAANAASAQAEDTESDDVDSAPGAKRIWSAVIECEPSPAEFYTSARVSYDWVSPKVVVTPEDELFDTPSAQQSPILDWQEPAPTFLSDPSGGGTNNDDLMGLNGGGGGKLPDVRFVARLEPPVIVPLPVAYEIYNTVGVQIPQESFRATTFDGLLVGEQKEPSVAGSGEVRHLTRERKLPTASGEKGGDEPTAREHAYSLYVPKQDYGRAIEEIPFSHPRHLFAILPILRQYVAMSNIIHNTLSPSTTTKADDSAKDQSPLLESKDELAALLADSNEANARPHTSSAESTRSPLRIDITLCTQPSPRISIVFPRPTGLAPSMITFDIAAHGTLRIIEQNLLSKPRDIPSSSSTIGPSDENDQEMKDAANQQSSPNAQTGKRKELTVTDLERTIDVAEDLGLFVEFIRRRIDPS
ncbi:MAG: glutamate--ammonia ligase [Chaenotheca gracillima]|nr:MAG: glutamate--ammonia ligase [Chaenotheca gracillima]